MPQDPSGADLQWFSVQLYLPVLTGRVALLSAHVLMLGSWPRASTSRWRVQGIRLTVYTSRKPTSQTLPIACPALCSHLQTWTSFTVSEEWKLDLRLVVCHQEALMCFVVVGNGFVCMCPPTGRTTGIFPGSVSIIASLAEGGWPLQ